MTFVFIPPRLLRNFLIFQKNLDTCQTCQIFQCKLNRLNIHFSFVQEQTTNDCCASIVESRGLTREPDSAIGTPKWDRKVLLFSWKLFRFSKYFLKEMTRKTWRLPKHRNSICPVSSCEKISIFTNQNLICINFFPFSEVTTLIV